MNHSIRMYNMFFPRKWTMWLIYLIYPVFVLVVGLIFFRFPFQVGTMMNLMLTCAGIVAVEYIIDVYMFYGIAAKDNRSLEYIKTSSKGVTLIQNALRVDGVRRLFTTGVSMVGVYLFAWRKFAEESNIVTYNVDGEMIFQPSVWLYVQCGLMIVLLVELGMCVTRRTKNVLVNLVFVYVMSALACPFVILFSEYTSVWIALGMSVLLAVLMVVNRKVLAKKVRESYYDTGCTELL